MEKPKIYRKNIHLSLIMKMLSLIGVWPLNLSHYPILKKTYFIFGYVVYFNNYFFVASQWLEAYFLIRERNIDRLMQNIGMTLLNSIAMVRTYVIRGAVGRSLSDKIFETEDKIMASSDEEIKKIYLQYTRKSKLTMIWFFVLGLTTATPFLFEPMAEERMRPELYKRNNVTGQFEVTRLLPLSAWYPFDTNQYYVATFTYQVISAYFIDFFITNTDGFWFSLIIFPSGQMEILQHILKNFRLYKKAVQEDLGLDDDGAARATMKSCILFHKKIISFVDELDHACRTAMLLDFLSCSLQMSVILFQIIMFPFGMPLVHASEFLISMMIQMFLFYWNANEITVQSLQVAKSIEESHWYEESEFVKKEFQIMMMRAQRPLTLSVGPFYPMSTDTAVSILKATYSYGMLLRQSYVRKV